MPERSNFYVMRATVSSETAQVTDPDGLPRNLQVWYSGKAFDSESCSRIPQPLVFTIAKNGLLGDYLETAIPLMHVRMLEVLKACCIENISIHEALIVQARSKKAVIG